MESSARTEKMELLRWWWWWWWWWLRSTRKGFEEEECHCCCLEFVEFTIKDGTSPLDWSSTSLNTPLNLPFTSIKALIATSVILFLSYHTYTHIHINLSCQAETPFVFKEFLILGTTKTATKAMAQQKYSPDRKRSRITNPICLIPQNSQSKFWQVSILESLSQVWRRYGIHHLERDVHVVLNIWHWFSDGIVDLLRELVDHLRHLASPSSSSFPPLVFSSSSRGNMEFRKLGFCKHPKP